jgi:hypothetical protein
MMEKEQQKKRLLKITREQLILQEQQDHFPE